ncbi:DUF3397 family protein [Lactobacillus rossiae]|uniref:DUF3397 family protein n=2 Tax=Furfurilactobacillus TaxID=2767882 RepID=A0A6N9I574_9LACO|nr:DUF3397 family protein [Furfurilactobacillus milii]MYV18125.1 DUF3397 family protein [Furfurilactobacillus milii]
MHELRVKFQTSILTLLKRNEVTAVGWTNQLLIQILTLILLYIILSVLRMISKNNWPTWIHPLDVLLPVLIVMSAIVLSAVSVRPLFLWAVTLWLIIGVGVVWRTFRGRQLVRYRTFLLIYWRVSDLVWLVIYILAIIGAIIHH